ncbi:PLP-dependent aminotransferase family protein [Photobacterium makurazakiensis]|uniref:MocR-like ectoine utilization transcription factor EhuR n=1 Tax=Photobacterium makurazakiensis TaxID=2910234 RepID=UPI003D0F517B
MTINLKLTLKPGVPKYLAISDAIEEAINQGDILAGTRLPTHRELAELMAVSVQTVSNAYAHAESKGIVDAWVGSGTFVSDYGVEKETEFMLIEDSNVDEGVIDLSIAHPVCTPQHSQMFNEALIKIAKQDSDALIRAVRPVQGLDHHIEAAEKWLSSQKLEAEKERIILCNGASHGLLLALGTVAQPGDVVACEALVDHGLSARSRMLKVKLCALAIDEEGIIPEAFEEACQQHTIKALCCTPSMNNPTSSHMSLARRQAIAEIAKRYKVIIIEDDVYGALEPNRIPPLSSLLPEQAFYITSLTKTVAPGMRAGYMVVPRHLIQHTITRLAASCWMASPIAFEVATLWINEGKLDRLITFQQQEISARQRMASDIFSGFNYDAHPNGQHIWLELPEGWGSDELVSAAKASNIIITGYQPFVVRQDIKVNRVRISLGMESSRFRVKHGLQVLADILNSPPPLTHFLL